MTQVRETHLSTANYQNMFRLCLPGDNEGASSLHGRELLGHPWDSLPANSLTAGLQELIFVLSAGGGARVRRARSTQGAVAAAFVDLHLKFFPQRKKPRAIFFFFLFFPPLASSLGT